MLVLCVNKKNNRILHFILRFRFRKALGESRAEGRHSFTHTLKCKADQTVEDKCRFT